MKLKLNPSVVSLWIFSTLLLLSFMTRQSTAFVAAPSSNWLTGSSRRATAIAYSDTVDRPHVESFEERMRSALNKPKQKQTATDPARPQHIHQVLNLQEYKQQVANEKEKIVVVRFYAPWCRVSWKSPVWSDRVNNINSFCFIQKLKYVNLNSHPSCSSSLSQACKAMTPSYYKFTRDLEDANIKFVDCPVTSDNAGVHQGLGITSIPFAHVYHPEAGLVEERKLSRRHYSSFEQVVKSYVSQSCDLKNEDCSDPWPNPVLADQ
jgi:hypothetical protein